LKNYLKEKYNLGEDFLTNASDFKLLLELFHQNQVDFQIKTRDGRTPALIFIDSFSYHLVDFAVSNFRDLFHYKIDITSANPEGDTPILRAASRGWTQVRTLQELNK